MYPFPYILIFSLPNITLVFLVFIFFTIVFILGYFFVKISTNSFSFGICFPFITNMHITSFVFIPTFITICLNNPFIVFSLYTEILFFFINSNTVFAISSEIRF